MSTPKPSISACRHCRFYQTEGRRGGHCGQLGVPVQSAWKACALASPRFASISETWGSRHSGAIAGGAGALETAFESTVAAYVVPSIDRNLVDPISIPVVAEVPLTQRLMA